MADGGPPYDRPRRRVEGTRSSRARNRPPAACGLAGHRPRRAVAVFRRLGRWFDSPPRPRYQARPMRVLITGGTGFTGSHAVRRYLPRGHSVRVLDNQKGVLFDELCGAGAEIQIGSVADREAVRKSVEGVELIHHVPAAFREINVPKSVYKSVNVDGTRPVAVDALRAGVRRVVYCPTAGVHRRV